jgi:hypothetical protein
LREELASFEGLKGRVGSEVRKKLQKKWEGEIEDPEGEIA